MEPTGSNTVFHVSDIERSIVGNERGHSSFPESVGSHVVSGNAECLRFVGAKFDGVLCGQKPADLALTWIGLNIVGRR